MRWVTASAAARGISGGVSARRCVRRRTTSPAAGGARTTKDPAGCATRTIADASAILDQPTDAPTLPPTLPPTPTPTEDDFEDFEDGEPIELLEKDCFLDTGLRPVIGVVTAVSGTVEVQRDLSGTYAPIQEGDADAPADPSLVAADSFVLRQGDVIRTGALGHAKVLIFEKPIPVAELASQAGTPLRELGGNVIEIDGLGNRTLPGNIGLFSNTTLCVRLGMLGIPGTVVDVIRGAIHEFLMYPSRVEARWVSGPSVIGIRGTEFVLAHWPDEGETALLLFEGEIAVEAPGPEVSLPEGSWVLVNESGAGDLWALSEDGWLSVLAADDPLAAIRALERVPWVQDAASPSPSQSPLRSPSPSPSRASPTAAAEAGDSSDDGSFPLIVVVIALALIAVGGGAGWLYRRRSSSTDEPV